jgi:hypothetical protein
LIPFRQHVVTIVAIFLALGIGVLMGTTVVKQGLVDQLKRSADNQANAAKSLRQQVSQLGDQVRLQTRFIDDTEPALVRDQLTGTQVVIVTVDGVDPSAVDGVRNALEDSGASVVAVLVATPRLALTDRAARAQLSTLLGTAQATPSARIVEEAAGDLGTRLAGGSDPNAQPDMLQQLATDRFLAIRSGTTSDPAQIGGPDQSLVAVAGNATAPLSFDPRTFLPPLLASVLRADPSRPVVAAETQDSMSPFLGVVRNDGQLHTHLVTVDDADTVPGQVAVVLGLHDLQLSPGDGGDYGVSCGSCQLVPSPGP